MKEFIMNFAASSDDWLIEKLFCFLDEEQYDTESVRNDIETNKQTINKQQAPKFHGNICMDAFGEEIPILIAKFDKSLQSTCLIHLLSVPIFVI